MRKFTISALVVALASLAVASSASAWTTNSTSDLNLVFNANGVSGGTGKYPLAGTAKPGGLYLETTTVRTGVDSDPQHPTVYPTTNATNGLAPSVYAEIQLDNEFKYAPPGTGSANAINQNTCNYDLSAATTQQALQLCGNRQIGSGSGTVCAALAGASFPAPGYDSCLVASNDGGTGASPGDYYANVTAFTGPPATGTTCNNGVDGQGKPTIILHGRNDALGLTSVLTGCMEPTGTTGLQLPVLGGDYAGGKTLSVKVPLIAGGAGGISDFSTNVREAAQFKASCTDANQEWNAAALVVFANGAGLGSNGPSFAAPQTCPRKAS